MWHLFYWRDQSQVGVKIMDHCNLEDRVYYIVFLSEEASCQTIRKNSWVSEKNGAIILSGWVIFPAQSFWILQNQALCRDDNTHIIKYYSSTKYAAEWNFLRLLNVYSTYAFNFCKKSFFHCFKIVMPIFLWSGLSNRKNKCLPPEIWNIIFEFEVLQPVKNGCLPQWYSLKQAFYYDTIISIWLYGMIVIWLADLEVSN